MVLSKFYAWYSELVLRNMIVHIWMVTYKFFFILWLLECEAWNSKSVTLSLHSIVVRHNSLFWLLSSENKSQSVQYGLLSVPPYFSSPVITCSAWHPWQRPFCHCHLYIDSLLPAKVHIDRLAHMILWPGFYGSIFENLVGKYIN